MQGLLNGADCSAGANPLNQVLKREGVDNSLYRDRTAGAGPSNFQAPFRPTQLPAHLQPSSSNATSRQASPLPFDLSQLNQHFAPRPQQQQQQQQSRQQVQQWAGQFQPQQQQQPTPVHNWANDFQPRAQASTGMMDNGKGKGRATEPLFLENQSQGHMPSLGMGTSMGLGMGMGMQRPFIPQSSYSGPASAQNQREPTAKDFDEAEALARVSQPVEAEAQDEGIEEHEKGGDFDAVWESLRPEAERLGKLAEWEAEFSQFVENHDEAKFDLMNDALAADFASVGQASLDEQFEVLKGGDGLEVDGMPKRAAYEFDPQNPFIAKAGMTPRPIPSTSSISSLSDRALALEAQILRRLDPSSTNISADIDSIPTWCELGRMQAMNEKETLAMRAYESAMDLFEAALEGGGVERVLDEHRAQISEMMVALAISYTNESLDLAALRTLHRFLQTLHPTFAGPVPQIDGSDPWAPHSLMTDAFLALARSQYASQQQVDPDVQVGLGTLYYMIGNFEEAKSCWQAALEERPEDFSLWNRLGATLANSGHPEQAVDAYRRALELNPTYTRAIYNLGVSCLNIGVHKEAAEHFLAGLHLQMQPQQALTNQKGLEMSDEFANSGGALWSVLRRALVGMGRSDLADRAVVGADLEQFRAIGLDF